MRRVGVTGIAVVVACLSATTACTPAERDTVRQPDTSAASASPAASRAGGAPLDLGDNDEMISHLDSLVRLGGTAAVTKWAERELRPGRQITYVGRRGTDVETVEIADRSVWKLDDSGKPSSDALLEPLTDEKFGTSEVFGVWSRPQAEEPFALRIRSVTNTGTKK